MVGHHSFLRPGSLCLKYPTAACAALFALATSGSISAMEVTLHVTACGSSTVVIEANNVKAGDKPEPEMSKLLSGSEVCPSGHTQVVKTTQVDAPGSRHISWSFQCVAPVTQAKTNGPTPMAC